MPTTGKLKGRALLIYVDGNAITHSKSADLTINGNLVESTTKDSDGWMEYEDAGNKGANLSTDALLALDATYGISDIFTLLAAGTTISWKYSTNVSGDDYFTGSAKVDSINISANDGDLVQYSTSLSVTGPVTQPNLT